MNNRKVLIVGGAGYIGSILSGTLLKHNYVVKSLDLLLYENHPRDLNYFGNCRYEFIYGDMVDEELMERALEGVDIIVLLAGLVGDPITRKYPEESAVINDSGVKAVFEACVNSGIKRLLFVSTCSNYGLTESGRLIDENCVLNPLSLYAKSKVNAEQYLLSLKGKVNYHPTILRFATAFGLSPRMRFDLTVNEFTRELAIGNELLVYDPHTWRPYCHVRDFARLIQMVIEAPTEEVSFEVFNAGSNINNATKQMIVDTILEKIPDGKIRYKKHGSDPRNYRVSFDKVRSVFGFEPKYLIQDGIDEIIASINNHLFDCVDEKRSFFGNYEIHYPIST